MTRLTIAFVILAALGCATTNDGSDRYTSAANSWQGAKIIEMVAAWGTPNRGYLPPKGEQNGIAGWESRSESGVFDRKHTRYYCTTFAHFDSNGTILRIDVQRSRYCQRRFENQFESMTRDADAPAQGSIRT